MERFTYLAVEFFAIIICFFFSFHPKIRFSRYFWTYLKASIVVALPFLIWDAWFTDRGVWWFNDRYIVGFRVFDLPIEEILFFITIPFSCVFTYFCLTKFFNLRWSDRITSIFVISAAFVLVVLTILSIGKIYPFLTCLVTTLSIVYLHYIARFRFFSQATTVYGILLIGFFLVNGVLTGTGLEEAVVNYNSDDFWNFRIGTVPVEDAVYGYTMILWNVYFFHRFKNDDKEIE
ncbi:MULTISPECIES: lycopene cyclase domain-containing protein [Sphingobacterium]|uniref:lycopene cyclase domain-containing protein n=1 Tax=Sphingobacterium TaxID=28453 RepID=UPI0013DAC58A|nr:MULTISPECIES: lycopene cyclase domain-containing protein [unclassified Sphingobacterium]